MALLLDGLNFDEAVDYHYGHFPPQEFDYGRLIDPLARAIAAMSRFDQMLQNLENEEIVLSSLRTQEAVISSRMDGSMSTVDEMLAFGADLDSGVESSIRNKTEAQETYFYQRALASAQASIGEGQTISKFLLKALHLISFEKDSTAVPPGKFKNEQNYLTDHTSKNVLFVPISPEKLEEGLHTLFTYIENEKEQALLKAAVAYLEYEALQPFEGGNGRVGRMLVALMLWSFGVVSTPHFYISRYIEKYRNTYFQAKQNVSAEKDWTGWCEFFLHALESQAIHHMQLSKEIFVLYRQLKSEFAETISSKWSNYALDYIFTHPVFRNNQFTHQAQIPRSSAARFTRILVDKKILRTVEKPSGRRAGLYSFEPLVQLIRV